MTGGNMLEGHDDNGDDDYDVTDDDQEEEEANDNRTSQQAWRSWPVDLKSDMCTGCRHRHH